MIETAAEQIAREHARIAASLDALAAVDLRELDQRELAAATIESHALRSRLDAHVTRAVGVFDTHGDPQGAYGTGPWVAHCCRVKRSQAKAELSRARALRHMPVVAAAFAAGQITGDHVSRLGAAQRANPDEFAKAEAGLVDKATTQRFDAFERRVAYFRQEADPDGAEKDARDAFARRSLHAARTFEDTVDGKMLFDPVGGTIWLNELNRLERHLFEADWAEARERLGDQARSSDLQRTSEQRRLDAQVEMARRSGAMPEGSRFNRPLITVLVGYETFAGRICQLADGTVVTPGQVVALLTDADVERVVFDGPSRVIDVGAKQRLFTGGTRRAVEVRDLFCTGFACDVSYERADIDHIQRYEHDGPTIQTNGRVRCPHHNPGRRRERRPEPPPDDD